MIPPSEESSGKGYTNSYDHLGRVTEKRNITGDLIEALSYDDNGNVLTLTDGEGNRTRYAYDIGNRLIRVTKPEDSSPVAEYTYNVRDQIIEEKSGSQRTSYERDIWGNILKTTDALGEITRYEYDLLGNLLKITDPKEGEITYTYNSMNAVSSITDQSGSVERFFYNTMGQLIEKEEKDGRRISYAYTPQGGLKEVKDKSTGDLKQYLYSKNNNLIGLINKTDITTYDLNRAGEIERVYHNGIKTHDYDYNDDGKMTAIRVSGHTLNYSYDRNGRLETVKDGSDLKGSYTYNDNSQLKTITYGNGLVSSFTYDGNSRIASESYTIGSKTLQSNSYAYDLQGNITTKTVGDLTESYTYDALNRLKTVGYSDDRVSEEYFYDELGNRSLKNIGDAQEVYTYNDVNQLIRLSAPAGVTTYTYDRRGNLTEETLNSETTTYTYNCFDQLLEVRNNQGYHVNRFDAEGNRNNVLYNGREQNKLYLGQQVLSELNNKGQEKVFYSRGTTLLETDQNVKGTGYYLNSSRGDILSVLDESGQTLNSYTYDAFGKTLNQVEELYNPYKYAGYEQDRLKNDYYLNARTYRPDIGRFLQEDNYRGDGLNLYAYVANNPLIYVDPSGYSKQCPNEVKAVTSESGLVESPYNWDEQLSNNIKPLIDQIPSNISGEERSKYIDAIILSEANKLQSKYRTIYNASNNSLYGIRTFVSGEENVHNALSPLYEQFPTMTEQDNEIFEAFMSGFVTGLHVGAWEAASMSDPKATNGRINLVDDTIDGIGDINPNKIRFSQSSVNGSEEIIESMVKNGWAGDPIDVIKMADGGLTTIDNTRVVAARAAGIDVKAVVHNADDILPKHLVDRFTTKKGVPSTWGEAVELRIGKQNSGFRTNNPYGSFEMEMIK